MTQSFGDVATEHVFYGEDTKPARTIPKAIWPTFASPPGNRLEVLKGTLAGRYRIWLNDQYRITFRFEAGHAWEVRCEDCHS